MSKFLPLLAAAWLLASCSDRATDTQVKGATDQKNDQAQKYIQMNRDVYKGIETGDTTLFASIADDCVDHSGPEGPIKGGAAIRRYLAETSRMMTGTRIEIKEEALSGDYLFTRNTMTGTAKEDWMGMKKGAAMNVTAVDLVRFKDGKIVEHWSYIDPADMMKMMQGSMPPPAAGAPAQAEPKK